MVKILIVEKISEDGLRTLRAHKKFTVDYLPGLKTAELAEKLVDAEALVVRTYTKVNNTLLDGAKKLKLVCRVGVGLDNIDLDYCRERKIAVINTPLGNRISTAEHTLGLIIALSRNIPQASQTLKTGGWNQESLIGLEVHGKTLGIVGLGNIGSLVANYAKAIGMKVIAHDPYLPWIKAALIKVKIHPLDYVLKHSDFVTLHVPLTEETRGMANKSFFDKMKSMSFFINASRGAVVDENALVEQVNSRHINGAALDVFNDEPLKDVARFSSPKFILTPHVGGKTFEAVEKLSAEAAEKIIKFFG